MGLKPAVKDEVFDSLVSRPMSRRIARALYPLGVTANQVTLSTVAVAILVGFLFASPWPGPFWGALLFLFLIVLDCVDGDLARMRGGGGWRGRIYDGLADAVGVTSAMLGMVIYLSRQEIEVAGYQLGFFGWLLVFLVAGISFAWHSSLVDGAKQRLSRTSLDRNFDEVTADARSRLECAMVTMFARYVRWIGRHGNRHVPGAYRLFRRLQWVGPTHHHVVMSVAALATGVWPAAYLGYWLFAVVLANLYMVTTLASSRSIVRMQATSS